MKKHFFFKKENMSLAWCKAFIPWRDRSKEEEERKGGDMEKECVNMGMDMNTNI
ncbi:MAG: hypothetical protein KAU16_07425 [Methanophagales archaeon]|nr:hypothetical protein [Methanophagales archaeon]